MYNDMIKRISIASLQIAVVLIGIMAFAIMIRFPLTEGRAINLDIVSIYTDPLLMYGYFASMAFFYALYQTYKLLGYMQQDMLFSKHSIDTLTKIKYSSILLSLLIIGAGICVRIFHAQDDDPAGFLALCIVAIFVLSIVATVATMLQRRLYS